MTRVHINTLKAKAKRMGCAIEAGVSGRVYAITIDAPAGYMFSEGTHCLCATAYLGNRAWIAEEIQLISDRMDAGLTPCIDNYCEHCT